MRMAFAFAAGSLLLAMPVAAAPQDPPPAVKTMPKANPPDGTVIKPPRTVDPGIQAKTPAPEHFPTPVITPAPSAPPR